MERHGLSPVAKTTRGGCPWPAVSQAPLHPKVGHGGHRDSCSPLLSCPLSSSFWEPKSCFLPSRTFQSLSLTNLPPWYQCPDNSDPPRLSPQLFFLAPSTNITRAPAHPLSSNHLPLPDVENQLHAKPACQALAWSRPLLPSSNGGDVCMCSRAHPYTTRNLRALGQTKPRCK